MKRLLALVLLVIFAGAAIFVYGGDIEKTTLNKCKVQDWDMPLNERIITKTLPMDISEYLTEKLGTKEFRHIGTLSEGSLRYSIIEIGSKFPPRAYYVIWDNASVKGFGELRFRITKENSNSEIIHKHTILTIHGRRTVQVVTWKNFKVAEVSNVESLKNIKVILAEYVYVWKWVGGKDTLAKTAAKGRFWVDYGNRVMDVDDLSWEYHDMKVGLCSFSHSVDNGPISAGVYADAHYHMLFRHFDSHPRVFVNAWGEVDFDGYGNKWNGGIRC